MSTHRITLGMVALALCLHAPAALSGPGHDHGEEAAPQATGPAAPRFAATSELFELVGVLDGDLLTLYLDHADSNAPVENAELEFELGPDTLTVEPVAPGTFGVHLPAEPAEGEYAVVATVITADAADVLVGTLDVHHADEAATDEHDHAEQWLPWAIAGGALLALLAALLRDGRGREVRA
ncbi:hypothetical protein [Pseudazoarcus pumilus]|uniref:Uncharacterized protein n=1 Tax=Pseudazoarcus pumilus TaxID=2067960 RepID=A0A2I6S5X8_9RHOO|nr:hypothetical protein [Pseudazoarcus pumilus]AUN94656.1 hypothetical protein C0099_06720 [Pseudazoarcus pumilus]